MYICLYIIYIQLESLLRKYVGFDIDNKDCEGFSMLHKAAYNGHVYMIKFLISKGANIDTKDVKFNLILTCN